MPRIAILGTPGMPGPSDSDLACVALRVNDAVVSATHAEQIRGVAPGAAFVDRLDVMHAVGDHEARLVALDVLAQRMIE